MHNCTLYAYIDLIQPFDNSITSCILFVLLILLENRKSMKKISKVLHLAVLIFIGVNVAQLETMQGKIKLKGYFEGGLPQDIHDVDVYKRIKVLQSGDIDPCVPALTGGCVGAGSVCKYDLGTQANVMLRAGMYWAIHKKYPIKKNWSWCEYMTGTIGLAAFLRTCFVPQSSSFYKVIGWGGILGTLIWHNHKKKCNQELNLLIKQNDIAFELKEEEEKRTFLNMAGTVKKHTLIYSMPVSTYQKLQGEGEENKNTTFFALYTNIVNLYPSLIMTNVAKLLITTLGKKNIEK